MTIWNPRQPPEDGLPPQEVRIQELRAEPWPGEDRRVKIHLRLTPFLEKPDIHVVIEDSSQNEVASVDIIESFEDQMTFTMHIRGDDNSREYTLIASLNYPEVGTVAQNRVVFEIPEKSD